MVPVKRAVSCLLVLAGVHFVVTSSSDARNLYEVNICQEEHKFRCKQAELISLKDLKCGSNGSPCSQIVNKTLFDRCDGHQTCSSLGLADMFTSQCRNNVTWKDSLLVKFSCLPGSTSSCRSNICSENSNGLVCPNGSLVHIRGMTCGSVSGKCPASTYANMHVCEGVDRCAASGLKTLLPQNCQHEGAWRRNVVVQYFCVPERQIDNNCTSGKSRKLDKDFGVVISPSRDLNTLHGRTSCKWHISPTGNKRVKVVINLISAKVTKDGCDPRVLSIIFVDCKNGSVITRSFCNVNSSKTELVSCGNVSIKSSIPHGEEPADMFIVSYQTFLPNASNTVPDGLPSCLAPPEVKKLEGPLKSTVTVHTLSTTKTTLRPSSKSMSVGRNYGPGDGLFEYRDSMYEEDAAGIESSQDSNTLSKHLRLMILYIFFGVVILVLAVALIAVIISYSRLSKLKGHRTDSSEKTALWQHHDETPLETFLNNNLAVSSGTITSETTCAFKADKETAQVVATVHHDAIDEDETGALPIAGNGGNGVSTFLAGKRDSNCKDLSSMTESYTLALNARLGSVSNDSQKNGPSNIGDGYSEIGDVGHYAVPAGCDDNIYEVIDLDNHKSSRIQKRKSSNLSVSPDTPSDTNFGDKHYEITYCDPAVVGLQRSPSNDLHYRINNDEYAVVSKTCKPMKPPNTTTANEDQQMSNNTSDSGSNIAFHPASGPYDRQRKTSSSDSNTRWSKGDTSRWTDEV